MTNSASLFAPEFVQSLHAMDWFAHCGEALSEQPPFDAVQVPTQKKAMRQCASSQWEAATLEARNDLTGFLAVNAKDRYQQWNEIAHVAKEQVSQLLAEKIWLPYARQHGLDMDFVHCVQWDVLGLCMEHAYRDLPRLPQFFHGLRKVYQAGHFPCGWEGGQYPKGRLLVW